MQAITTDGQRSEVVIHVILDPKSRLMETIVKSEGVGLKKTNCMRPEGKRLESRPQVAEVLMCQASTQNARQRFLSLT